ncbi:MAG: DUF465 domain-containing protein [Polyangiaceae bacterium]|jgi:hypothetical protein
MKRIDIRELEASHRILDQAVHELERRGLHMTPEDRLRALELKKMRLAARDRLVAARSL